MKIYSIIDNGEATFFVGAYNKGQVNNYLIEEEISFEEIAEVGTLDEFNPDNGLSEEEWKEHIEEVDGIVVIV